MLKQHLIDAEICIRCNTCEATCPVGAVTHDDNNYVVDATKCNFCLDCIAPCPTGSIDNWRTMPKAQAYSVTDQLGWDELPTPWTEDALTQAAGAAPVQTPAASTMASEATVASVSTPEPWLRPNLPTPRLMTSEEPMSTHMAIPNLLPWRR